MDQKEVFEKVVAILKPFAKNREALENVKLETSIQKDSEGQLGPTRGRRPGDRRDLGIQVKDEDADKVRTVGDAVSLVTQQMSA